LHIARISREITAYLRAKIAQTHRHGIKKSKIAFPAAGNLLGRPAQEFTDSGINQPDA
jgi:hypothetical protein